MVVGVVKNPGQEWKDQRDESRAEIEGGHVELGEEAVEREKCQNCCTEK